MPEPRMASDEPEGDSSIRQAVDRVCRRIPPLWDLTNYVAVNPFLGFSDRPIAEAAREVRAGLGASVLPGVAPYRDRWEAGEFGPDDLARASARSGFEAEPLAAILDGTRPAPSRAGRIVPTVAERVDRERGTSWGDAMIRQITRWCAVHASGGGAYWRLPQHEQGLYASWREAARFDRSLELFGLAGWRREIASLPGDPIDAIAAALERVGVAPEDREPYLYRLLGGVYGWASFFRREGWERQDERPGLVAELLAIRAVSDAAVAALAYGTGSPGRAAAAEEPVEDESIRVVFQEALEDGFARRLLARFNPPGDRPEGRPEVQAIFCIDVRSEPLRRHLEAQSDAIETKGFAGFFGIPLAWRGDGAGESARCPVLLKPALTVASGSAEGPAAVKGVVKHLLGAPASAFEFVELLGPAYSLGLAADAMALRAQGRPDEGASRFALDPDGRGAGIPAPQRVDLAAGILKNTGLRGTFARLVLLCGHEGRSANNPHAAGLDCGACGGHGGAINARVAAALLNDRDVREGLRERGFAIPDDAHFLPGVHDTSVDEVRLLDLDRVPESHRGDLEALRRRLDRAGMLTRAERAGSLGLSGRPAGVLGRLLRRRSRDWSEVRPEWGLARNAAFIAARRCRTRHADLNGRAFLHDYDAALDDDGSVLTLILSAPMVVASWINLQYFASTVDNHVFGCGSKTLHNRVGTLGVVLGNGGDLRTGLPIQSVHAPNGHWFHDPLRLQVVVEAPRERIDAVLEAQPAVRQLVENGWVRLFALDPEGAEVALRLPDGTWEPFDDERGAPTLRTDDAVLVPA